MDPEAFEKTFRKFTREFSKALPKDVVAIDGKSIKSAFHSGQQHIPPMMVSAWAADLRLVLSQLKVESGNETEAAIRLVSLLDIEGVIVTADALHCNRVFTQTVLDQGADYALTLKENQVKLFKKAEQSFADCKKLKTASTEEKSHGRQEVRIASVISIPNLEQDFGFPGLTAFGRIASSRDEATATRYYVLSKQMTPGELLSTIRNHWTIENSLHWGLDVTMREDNSRSHKDHAPENIAMIRKLALNILKAHSEKISVRRKIKKAGWNNEFLKSMLFNMR